MQRNWAARAELTGRVPAGRRPGDGPEPARGNLGHQSGLDPKYLLARLLDVI
jgi:hypothetical protein